MAGICFFFVVLLRPSNVAKRERRRQQREYDAAHAAKGDELMAIFAEMDKTFSCFEKKDHQTERLWKTSKTKTH